MADTRVCRSCGFAKPLNAFCPRAPNKIGVVLLKHSCRSCDSAKTLVGVKRNAFLRTNTTEQKQCGECNTVKPIADFDFERSLDKHAIPVLKSDCRVCERTKSDAILLQKKNAIDKRLYAERREAEIASRKDYKNERDTITETKVCLDCHQEKPVSEFVFSRTLKSGIRQFAPRCNLCKSLWRLSQIESDPMFLVTENKRSRDWHLANIEFSREYHRTYNLAYLPQWHLDNPGKSNEYRSKRRALMRDAPGHHTAQEMAALRKKQGDKCAICRKPLRGKGSEDHRLALIKGGSNDIKNMQWTCISCNSKKKAHDEITFMQSFGFLI